MFYKGHEVLKASRVISGHTQKQSADLTSLSVRQFRRLETGKSIVTFNFVMKMIAIYKLEITEVLATLELTQGVNI